MTACLDAVRCPVCGEPAGDSPVLCPDCDTPHHDDCWAYNGGCAIYGCAQGRQQRVAVIDDARRLDLTRIPFDAASGNTAQSATALLVRLMRALLVWVLVMPFIGGLLALPLAVLAAFGSRRWILNPADRSVEESVTLAGWITLHRKRISFLDVESIEIRPQITERDGHVEPRLMLVVRRLNGPNLVLSARRHDLTEDQIDDLALQLRHGGAFHVVRPRKLPLDAVLKHLSTHREDQAIASFILTRNLRPLLAVAVLWALIPTQLLSSTSSSLVVTAFFAGSILLGAFSGRGDPYLPPVEFSDLDLSIRDPLELVDGALAELRNERHLSARMRRKAFGVTYAAFLLLALCLTFALAPSLASSIALPSLTAILGLLLGFAVRAHWEDVHVGAWLAHAESVLQGLARRAPESPDEDGILIEDFSEQDGDEARRA